MVESRNVLFLETLQKLLAKPRCDAKDEVIDVYNSGSDFLRGLCYHTGKKEGFNTINPNERIYIDELAVSISKLQQLVAGKDSRKHRKGPAVGQRARRVSVEHRTERVIAKQCAD